MIVSLTTAGIALLQAAAGPVALDSCILGSGVNYIPEVTDTNIHGTAVFTTDAGAPTAVSGNIAKYSVYLDYGLGPFAFGEFGLFAQGNVLFALGAGNELVQKLQLTSVSQGNSIRLDIYISSVGGNFDIWVDQSTSNNQFRMAVLSSVDALPQSQNAIPNAYIVNGVAANQSAFLAYTNRVGLWNFDAYAFADQATATVTGFDFQSVTIALSDYVLGMNPAYLGEVILEFSTGALYSTCRYISSAVISGGFVTLGFDAPLMKTPIVGDKFIVFGRQALSTTIPNLPIASHTLLGAVIVGDTITVDETGLINVAPTAFPVTSVNDQVGDVELTADDIPGISAVGKSGLYSDLVGAPIPYSLPVASTTVLGGVKAPADNDLTIAGDGTIDLSFTPVKTINGVNPDTNGNVELTAPILDIFGLIQPTQIPNAADLNTYQQTGLFFVLAADVGSLLNKPGALTTQAILEVAPFVATMTAGDVVQTMKSGSQVFIRGLVGVTWGPWVQLQTSNAIPAATTALIGGVIVGAGLNVASSGLLSTQIQSVNGKTDQSLVLDAADVGAASLTQLGGFAGASQFAAATVNITILNANQALQNAATVASVWTMPGVSTIPVDGTGYTFYAYNQSTFPLTLTASGADTFHHPLSADSASIVVGPGQNVEVLVRSDTNQFDVIGGSASATNPFPLMVYAPGTYMASQVIYDIVIPVVATFSALSAQLWAKAQAAPTGAITCVINRRVGLLGAVTQVGTITFTAGSLGGNVTITTSFTTAVGDTVFVTAPSTADATFAGLSASILGTR